MAFFAALKNFKEGVKDLLTPAATRKRHHEGLEDAERPHKRQSAGEAPQPAAAAPLWKSKPSVDAYISIEKHVWANVQRPFASTLRPRGGSGLSARRSQLAPPADPLPQPRREVEVRVAARPVAPALEHPIAQLSPEEKSRYDRDSFLALKIMQERSKAQQAGAEPTTAAAAAAPVHMHQEFIKILDELQQKRDYPQMGARLRDVDLVGAGLGPIPTGRTAAEEADMAKQKFMDQDRLVKAASQRASVALRGSREGEKKNKEKADELQRELERLEALRLKVAKVPEISDEDRAEYKQLISAAETSVLASHPRSKIDIKGHDMRTLAPGAWLNDEVINLCISLLQERDLRWREEGAGAPTCHFFNSFFFNKMYKDSKKYNYNEVRRWTLPVRLKNAGQASASILDCDRIIIPANQGNMHWVCAMADLKNKKFVLYDSLGGEDKQCLKNLAQYVKDEFKNKKDEERDDVLSWPREFPKDIPRQANGYDCGVFTILFAEYCGKNAAMNFNQENIEDFRVRIVRDIMRLKID